MDDVKKPSFAVIQISPGMEEKLLRILSDNGYNEISFANSNGELINVDDDEEKSNRSIDESASPKSESPRIDDDEEEEIDVEENSNQGLLIIDEKRESSDDENLKIDNEKMNSFEKLQSILMDQEKLAIFIEHQKSILLENQKLGSIDRESPITNPNSAFNQQRTGSSNIEFSSLTLPTVLLSDQKLQFPFPNPFLNLPFFPYLPQNLRAQPLANQAIIDAQFQLSEISGHPQTTPIVPASSMTPGWPFTTSNPMGIQILDTPPSTPRNRSGGSSASSMYSNESAGSGGHGHHHGVPNGQNCLITGAKLRQRGKQLRRQERDVSAYASCRLCRNRILANRLSNLHNHVRRHAVLKQFHCCYCSYAHTEVAKVRLHMLHNHKDDRTQPLDKRNDDMEAAWSMLMKECFPGYA